MMGLARKLEQNKGRGASPGGKSNSPRKGPNVIHSASVLHQQQGPSAADSFLAQIRSAFVEASKNLSVPTFLVMIAGLGMFSAMFALLVVIPFVSQHALLVLGDGSSALTSEAVQDRTNGAQMTSTALRRRRVSQRKKRSSTASASPSTSEDAATSQWYDCLVSEFPPTREQLFELLHCMGLTGVAVEVGVQRGVHASHFLRNWQGKELILVDAYHHVPSSLYVDIANVADGDMSSIKSKMLKTMAAVDPGGKRHRLINKWSREASLDVADGSLDFVYLDARHDFNGVSEDLFSWWPRIKIGGVIAGHDFCDGELPEGDFFVRSAVAHFLGVDVQTGKRIITASRKGSGAGSISPAKGRYQNDQTAALGIDAEGEYENSMGHV